MGTYLSKYFFKYVHNDSPTMAFSDRISYYPGSVFTTLGRPETKTTKVSNQYAEQAMSGTLFLPTQTARDSLLAFFDTVKGRLTAFWVRSFKRDYALASAAASGASALVLENDFQDLALYGIYRHVWIEALDQCAKIAYVSQNPDGTQNVSIDPVLTGDLPAGTEIESLYLMRFAQDVLTIQSTPRNGVGTCEAAVSLIEVQGETP